MTISGVVAGVSVAAARRALAAAFAQAGVETPDLDARVLIGHALRLDAAALATTERSLDRSEAARIANLAARRLRREPVARIIGVKEFWSLPIAVSPATLVPRPETETLVEAALEVIEAQGASERPLRIADLGTGSGAILLALLSELPVALGIGTDISLDALKTACANAERLDFAERARFVACNFGAALAGPFDLVVSNPPYIRSADIPGLAPEVRDSDPLRALDGGADGLDAYRTIAADAARLIGPRGHLILELGAGQAGAVAALFDARGLQSGNARPDLAGVPRALHICVPEKR